MHRMLTNKCVGIVARTVYLVNILIMIARIIDRETVKHRTSGGSNMIDKIIIEIVNAQAIESRKYAVAGDAWCVEC